MKQPAAPEYFLSIKALRKNNTIFSILVGAYVFTWFTEIGKRVALLGTIRFEFLLGAGLTIASIYLLQQKPHSHKSSTLGAITIILLMYYGIFAFASFAPEQSWFIYFNRVIKFALLPLFFYAIIDNIYKLSFVLFCYFLASAKAGQEGLIGFITGNMVWQNQGIPRLHGSIDMYGHPNSFSGFGVCLLPFLYCFFPLMNKYMKLGLLFLSLCAGVIILFTGSRSGYVATALLIGFAVLKTFRKSFTKFILIVLPLFILAITFMPDAYKGRFDSIFTGKDQEGGSTIARKQILIDGYYLFLAHPFGIGINAFPVVREGMFGRSQDTHNLYLQVLTNTGVPGLIIFILFIFRMLKVNKQIILMHKNDLSFEAKFLTATANATIGYLWTRIFLGVFGMDMYEIYWWLALGLTISNFYISTDLRKVPLITAANTV